MPQQRLEAIGDLGRGGVRPATVLLRMLRAPYVDYDELSLRSFAATEPDAAS